MANIERAIKAAIAKRGLEFPLKDETLYQWRNVISGGPRFKIFEGPPSSSVKGTS